ncbi:tetratricopeptide repeat protein [Snodgrassella sp. ESL0324]|uniref:SEL1-like repeat protein n=1 Tax=Snodgrassella sp. ESL0324 TaxID=2705033 RepID=UPI001582DFA9|nr:tetratricopeptide repeat protein [Snodgrassella sp. ESL0324]NUF08520.1 sel1 repeat family protein [Snodgrassella sp. ESL0324]
MEEKDIDQQIEELSKITREDGKETYAQAQFELGDIYRNIKHDYSQAEAFYLNINKEDNPEVYALAQFLLGYIYQEIKHDYDQAEAFYLNINKKDNPDVYAKTQFSLGYIYQEIKHNYDQAETFYLNINKKDTPDVYALALFGLGYIYNNIKHDYDQAEVFLLNINKEDNPEIYAQAQFFLGYIYQEIKHDYDQAEVFYLNINKEDNPEIYVLAQGNLGYIYHDIKHDYDQAEVFLLNINKEDNPEVYAKAQFFLGYIYQEIKHDYDQAEVFYLNINKKDNPEIYALAQGNLGYIYYDIKHDYDQAEVFLLNINKEDNPEVYAKAQFFLGYIYQEIKHDYDQAKAFYFKITKENNPEIYAQAQDILGKIYTEKIKKETQATDCFLLASKIESYSNRYPYQYICAQLILGLKQNNFNHDFNEKEFNELKDFIYNKIENLCNLTNNIKNILFISKILDNKYSKKQPERRVAHYTKPAVLFNLLKGENPSKFRLNIVDFMNDPSENQVLTSWLNISNHPDNEIKSFLASFSFNHNCLNQFRLYGNEDNIIGSGISIAFNKNFFGLDTERSINNEIISLHSIKSIKSFENKQVKLETEQIEIISANTLYPLPLYRCLYFDPETGYMALAKRNKQSFYLENKNEKTPKAIDSEWNEYIKSLDEPKKISCIRDNLEKIKELIKELLDNSKLQKISNLDELLSLAVLPISCLIKHAAFEDEDECRMIYITHIADDNIVEPQDYQSANSLYVEYTQVEEYIDNIYLGPQCKIQHKIWLQNHFKKKQREREIKLIKSEMPLR